MKFRTANAAIIITICAFIAVSAGSQGAEKRKAPSSPSPSPAASASPSASTSPAAKASPSLSPGTKMVRVFPFHGMISAVDAKTKTFTIAGKDHSRVFKLTDDSVITKAGTPATMKDVVAKEEVRGSYWKEADGTLMAKMVKVGPLTQQEKAAEAAAKAKRAEKKATPTASPSASPVPSATASAAPKL
jgi:hypothetical protein